MYIKIKIRTAALCIIVLGTLVFTTGYVYYHFYVKTPVGDIEVGTQIAKGGENGPGHVPAPSVDLAKKDPKSVTRVNLAGAYQSQSSSKIYIVSQDRDRIQFFERHPTFGDISLGNGQLMGDEIISDFFSTEAYGNVEEPKGTLHLEYDKTDHSLRGGFFVNGEKREDVVLLPLAGSQ